MPAAAKVIKDMPEMSKFVYDYYYKVIEKLMADQSEAEKIRDAEIAALTRFEVQFPPLPFPSFFKQ